MNIERLVRYVETHIALVADDKSESQASRIATLEQIAKSAQEAANVIKQQPKEETVKRPAKK